MIVEKLWLDTEGILVGCSVYSDKPVVVTRLSHFDEDGYAKYNEVYLRPKQKLVLSMDDMFLNKTGHTYMNSNGDILELVEYDDVTNIGEDISRYKLAYNNGRIITDMQRVKYITRDVLSAENMTGMDFRYLIDSYTMMDLVPLEVL